MKNMPCWYYEKKELRHTPSMTQGMQVDQENSFRREGARFILQVGNKMGLRYETMATGVVYFHRFYMVHTFQEFPRHVTACCCLFLAGKVEETPKKCKDIMKTAKGLIDDATWGEFGDDSKEEVMTLERILLQTIKFDFIVEHPYSYLLKYAKCLKGDKKKLHHIVQMAWTFVNDSLCTTLCLQWEPEIIAIALMYLAGKLHKFEVTDWQGRTSKQQKWWDMFVQGISLELLEDICHQVLDLYSANKAEVGPPGLGPAPENFTLSKTKIVEPVKKVPSLPLPPVVGEQPPPTKKVKNEDVKNFSSPAKTEQKPSSYSFLQTQYAANFPPAYPPPTAGAVPARYPYTYQPPPAPPRYPPSCAAPQPPPVTTVSTTVTQQPLPIYHPSQYHQAISYQSGAPTSHYQAQPQSHAVTPTTPTHHPPPNFPPPHVATPYYHPQTQSVNPRQQHYQQTSTPYGSTSYTPRTYYPPPT